MYKNFFLLSLILLSSSLAYSASDEIEVFVRIDATSPEIKSSTDGSVTWFSGFLVG